MTAYDIVEMLLDAMTDASSEKLAKIESIIEAIKNRIGPDTIVSNSLKVHALTVMQSR